jgi:hypothetical protein
LPLACFGLQSRVPTSPAVAPQGLRGRFIALWHSRAGWIRIVGQIEMGGGRPPTYKLSHGTNMAVFTRFFLLLLAARFSLVSRECAYRWSSDTHCLTDSGIGVSHCCLMFDDA